jgi:hypothetical protein
VSGPADAGGENLLGPGAQFVGALAYTYRVAARGIAGSSLALPAGLPTELAACGAGPGSLLFERTL